MLYPPLPPEEPLLPVPPAPPVVPPYVRPVLTPPVSVLIQFKRAEVLVLASSPAPDSFPIAVAISVASRCSLFS